MVLPRHESDAQSLRVNSARLWKPAPSQSPSVPQRPPERVRSVLSGRGSGCETSTLPHPRGQKNPAGTVGTRERGTAVGLLRRRQVRFPRWRHSPSQGLGAGFPADAHPNSRAVTELPGVTPHQPSCVTVTKRPSSRAPEPRGQLPGGPQPRPAKDPAPRWASPQTSAGLSSHTNGPPRGRLRDSPDADLPQPGLRGAAGTHPHQA